MPQETRPSEHTQGKFFDLEKALNNFDGDREVFQSLVFIFVEESSYQMEEIRQGIQGADASAVERAAHTIKGTVGNFAAQRTYELAYRLEVLSRERRLSELSQVFSELEQEMNLLKDALLKAAENIQLG
jgi:two-component system, sensor histidine kinase and response regulator